MQQTETKPSSGDTTDYTRPIISLGATTAYSIKPEGSPARSIKIPCGTDDYEISSNNQFVTTEYVQTLLHKYLVEPIIPSLHQASEQGTINMPVVASGSTVTLATTDDVASAVPTNMVTTDTAQSITGQKTIVNPIIKDSSTDFTISVPTLHSNDNLVTTSVAQTLYNKTLNTPIINALKNGSACGPITVPSIGSTERDSLALRSHITTATANMVTTDTTQTITGAKTFTGNVALGSLDTNSDITINVPVNHHFNVNLEGDFELSVPVDENTRRISLPGVPDMQSTNFVLEDSIQTLANKTLTSPVIASLKQSSTGGTINMPAVASGSSVTLAPTGSVPTVADFERVCGILGNLLTYLQNWVDVGNLNMNDIIEELDSTNYLGLIQNGAEGSEP